LIPARPIGEFFATFPPPPSRRAVFFLLSFLRFSRRQPLFRLRWGFPFSPREHFSPLQGPPFHRYLEVAVLELTVHQSEIAALMGIDLSFLLCRLYSPLFLQIGVDAFSFFCLSFTSFPAHDAPLELTLRVRDKARSFRCLLSFCRKNDFFCSSVL